MADRRGPTFLILPVICAGSTMVSDPTILRVTAFHQPSVLATAAEGAYPAVTPAGMITIPAGSGKAFRKIFLKLNISLFLQKPGALKGAVTGDGYEPVAISRDANKAHSDLTNCAKSAEFNLYLSEAITCHDYEVRVHNCHVEAKHEMVLMSMHQLGSPQRAAHYKMATDWENSVVESYQALARKISAKKQEIDVLVPKVKDVKRQNIALFKHSQWNRLDTLLNRLITPPPIASRDFTHMDQVPAKKQFYSFLPEAQRFAFLRGEWPKFQYSLYYDVRGLMDIEATFWDPIMNSFGESMFFEQADTAWFLYLRQRVQQIKLRQAEVHTSARGVKFDDPANPVTRTTDFRFDLTSKLTQYNDRVRANPILGAQYGIRDLSRVMVRPGSGTSSSGATDEIDREWRGQVQHANRR